MKKVTLVVTLLASVFCLGSVSARPNNVWLVQKRAAERCEDQSPRECEETLRRLKYVGTAGTVACIPGTFCLNGGTQISCCGEADAYEADDFETDDKDRLWAILTCSDPKNCEEIPGKIVRKPGEKFLIPPERVLMRDRPTNNTGHGWVWIHGISTDADGNPAVLCWAVPAGD